MHDNPGRQSLQCHCACRHVTFGHIRSTAMRECVSSRITASRQLPRHQACTLTATGQAVPGHPADDDDDKPQQQENASEYQPNQVGITPSSTPSTKPTDPHRSLWFTKQRHCWAAQHAVVHQSTFICASAHHYHTAHCLVQGRTSR